MIFNNEEAQMALWDDSNTTVFMPTGDFAENEMNKLGITAGLSFRPIEAMSVDVAFSYVTGFGRDGSYTDTDLILGQPRVFGGHYEATALMPAIGVSYAF